MARATTEEEQPDRHAQQRGAPRQLAARQSKGERQRSFTNTDLGNAERLLFRFGEHIRYDHDRAKWLLWDGSRWRLDATRQIEDWAALVARAMLIDAAKVADDTKRDKLVKFALASHARDKLLAMVKVAEPMRAVAARTRDFDTHDLSLNTPSGIVALTPGQAVVSPHDPVAQHSRITAVPFDPAAECPAWAAFVSQAMLGRPDLISYLQRAVGYSALAVRREEVVFFCYGTGGNGKTTFLETIKAALGEYAATVNANALLSRATNAGSLDPDIASLPGVRFVVASEMPETAPLDAAKIKALSGGDTITVRQLYRDPFEFRPAFQLWVAVNHRPRTPDLSAGFWRRVHLIPWNLNLAPEAQDRTLKTRLLEELPGILRWVVEGACAYLRDGLNPPAEVLAATADYRAINDPLVGFFADRCWLGTTASVEASALYAAYVEWCDQAGEKRPWSQRALGTVLTERGFGRASHPSSRRTIYLGVGLANGAQPASPPAALPLSIPTPPDDYPALFT